MKVGEGMVKLSDINFSAEKYPREKRSPKLIGEYVDVMASGATFPPIVLEQDTNDVLNGYHRWKAYLKYPGVYDAASSSDKTDMPVPSDEVFCEFHTLPDGIPAKLYALSLNSRHGLRPTTADRKQVAIEAYEVNPGMPLKTIAQHAGVSIPTARSYVKELIVKFETTKQTTMIRLDILGWTHQEISDRLNDLFPGAEGLSRMMVTEFLSGKEDFLSWAEHDMSWSADSPTTVAQRYDWPEILAWAIELEMTDNVVRMERLGITVQPYDLWNFSGCHPLFGLEHPGRIPGELVAHVLHCFTERGAVVIDPMAGGGTVPDVCLVMDRRCYGFDIDDRPEHRHPAVLKHDALKDGWPEQVKMADLIFWDPPYFEKKGDDYVEGSISGLGRE